MSATGKEAIQLRNEGAAAFIARAREFGTRNTPDWAAACDELRRRTGMKCNIAVGKAEHDASMMAIQEAVSNTYLTMVYTTLHDVYGFGEKRLKQFKHEFDAMTMTAYSTDPLGRRYFSVSDCAQAMNDLYNMGIDISVVEETENDVDQIKTRYTRVDDVFAFLHKNGFNEAYEAFFAEVWGKDCETNRARTKEQRAIAKKRRREDHKYRVPNMNLFDPEVSRGYLAVIATVMRESGYDFEQIDAFCAKVNEYLNWILQTGRDALETLEKENKDMAVGDKEDGNVTDNTDESYQAEVS